MAASWLIMSYFQLQQAGSIAVPWMCQQQNQTLFHTPIWTPRPLAFFFFSLVSDCCICSSRHNSYTKVFLTLVNSCYSVLDAVLAGVCVYICVGVCCGWDARLQQHRLGHERAALDGAGVRECNWRNKAMNQLSNTAGVYSCNENKAWDRVRADAEYNGCGWLECSLL